MQTREHYQKPGSYIVGNPRFKPDFSGLPDHLKPLYKALLTNPFTGKTASQTTCEKAQLKAQAGGS